MMFSLSDVKDEDNEGREMYPIPIYMIEESGTNYNGHKVKQNEPKRSNQTSHSSDVQRTSRHRFQKRGNIYCSDGRGRGYHAKLHSARRKERSEPRDENPKTYTVGNLQDTSTSEVTQNPVQDQIPGCSSVPYRNPKGRSYHVRGKSARRDQRYESGDEIQGTDAASNLQDTSKRSDSHSRVRERGRKGSGGRGIYRKTRVREREPEAISRTFQESSPLRQGKLMLEYEETTKSSRNSNEKKQCDEDDSTRSSVRIIGYKALKDILEMEDVEEMVLIVNNVRGGFPDCLKQGVLKPNWIVLIVGIFQKACLSHKHTYVLDAFHILYTSSFLDKVANVLSEIQLKSKETRGIWTESLQLSNFLESLICVLRKELELIPDSLVKCNSIFVHLNEIVQMFNFGDHKINIVTKLRTLEETKEAIRQQTGDRDKEDAHSFSKRRPSMKDIFPPDNFREISILPEMKDLQWNEKPLLRTNILRGLQEIHPSMPFQKYFVECQMEISPPRYLLGGVRLYDFTPLMKQKTVTDNCTQIEVLTTTRWPTSDELGLDSSQYKALQTALTKELAVIQGPPGTGKMFVGLKIVELLLHNHSVWKPSDAINPMLVVCYTNHALDQFLEGVLRFCPNDIVRIGGKCNNEALRPFVLEQLRCERRKERRAPSNIYRAEAQCRDNLKYLRKNIESVGIRLQACLRGILSVKRLKEVITDNNFESLKKGLQDDIDKCLLFWLGVTSALDPKEDAVDLKDSLQKRWKTAILQTSVCLKLHEAKMHINVWNLPLVDRVRMYKLWVQQTLDVLKNRIEELKVNMTSHAVSSQDLELLKELKNIQSACRTSIVHEQTLNMFLQNKSQRQIKSLYEVPTDSLLNGKVLIEEWLCLTLTFKDEAVIKTALKEIDPEARNGK